MEEKRSGASHLLSVGDKAPAFSLRDQNGNLVTLEEFKTRKNVVLVFYPGDNTPFASRGTPANEEILSALKEK
jgi:peroxiredoxin Q/BCP